MEARAGDRARAGGGATLLSEQQQFEVYPPAAQAGPATQSALPDPAPTWEQPDPPAASASSVTSYPPPPPPPLARPGLSRRDALGVIVGVPLAGIALVSLVSGGSVSVDEGGEVSTYEDSSFGSSSIDIGSYSVDVPDSWSQEWSDSGEAILTNGLNRVQLYNFTVNDGDQALDLVEGLVRQRMKAAKFAGTLGSAVDESDLVQRASVTAGGKLGKKAARAIGQLWIDDVGDALLLVRILAAKEGSAVSEDAQTMVDQLEAEFG